MKIGDSARFWMKVSNTDDPNKCWLWMSCLDKNGYGRFTLNRAGRRVTILAHRFALEEELGRRLSVGMYALHKPRICTSKACVNPAHLYPGTPGDNNLDKIVDGTDHNVIKTGCPRGHAYDITRKGRNGRLTRWCKKCLDETRRRSYHKRKAEACPIK